MDLSVSMALRRSICCKSAQLRHPSEIPISIPTIEKGFYSFLSGLEQ